ncbi:MAG: hypothetical protein QM777_11610 [Pseudorhodoferax sp.]
MNSSPLRRPTMVRSRAWPQQARADLAQQLVTHAVAQRVVEVLEVVDIDDDQGHAVVAEFGMLERKAGLQGGLGAVGQARDHILARQVGDLLFRGLARAQVGEGRHVVRDLIRAALAQRRQAQPLRVHLAVAAPVPDLAAPAALAGQHGPHLRVEGLVVLAGGQELGVAAQRLLGLVAGDLGEGRVHHDDAVVRVGDDDAVGALLQHAAGQFQLGRRDALVGHVAPHHEQVQALAAPAEGRHADHVVVAQVAVAVVAGLLHVREAAGLPGHLFRERTVVQVDGGGTAGLHHLQAARTAALLLGQAQHGAGCRVGQQPAAVAVLEVDHVRQVAEHRGQQLVALAQQPVRLRMRRDVQAQAPALSTLGGQALDRGPGDAPLAVGLAGQRPFKLAEVRALGQDVGGLAGQVQGLGIEQLQGAGVADDLGGAVARAALALAVPVQHRRLGVEVHAADHDGQVVEHRHEIGRHVLQARRLGAIVEVKVVRCQRAFDGMFARRIPTAAQARSPMWRHGLRTVDRRTGDATAHTSTSVRPRKGKSALTIAVDAQLGGPAPWGAPKKSLTLGEKRTPKI